MKTISYFLLFFTFTMMFCSCATIFTKSKYPISFNTTPSSANIAIENRSKTIVYTGVTPCVVKLKSAVGYMKREEYKITFTKDGYTPKIINLTSNLDGWYFGNILLGGIIGMLIVDPASGAMYKFAKDDRVINETLIPINSDQLSLQIIDINELPNNITKEDLLCIKE